MTERVEEAKAVFLMQVIRQWLRIHSLKINMNFLKEKPALYKLSDNRSGAHIITLSSPQKVEFF